MKKNKKSKTNKGKVSSSQKVGIGVGLTAAAVAAAGAYFLYGSKDAKKNRKKVHSWALKAKAEVLEALEQAEYMTKKEYETVVDGVAVAYGKLQSVSKTDMSGFKSEMKNHWNNIQKKGMKMAVSKMPSIKKKTAKVKKATAKNTKKTAKKSVKKTTKKPTKKKK